LLGVAERLLGVAERLPGVAERFLGVAERFPGVAERFPGSDRAGTVDIPLKLSYNPPVRNPFECQPAFRFLTP